MSEDRSANIESVHSLEEDEITQTRTKSQCHQDKETGIAKNGSFKELAHTDSASATSDSDIDQDDKPHMDYPDGGLKANTIVLACWIGFVSNFGLVNSTGAIESRVQQYILTENTATEISWIFSIFSFVAFGCNLISGRLFDKYGAKTISIIGSILLVGGLFATANCRTLVEFILGFGICCGVGCALLMAPNVSVIGHYFDKHRGIAMGIAMSGASVGGIVWPLLCLGLYDKVGYTWTIRILAFAMLLLLGIYCTLIDDRRKEVAQYSTQLKAQRLREREKLGICEVSFSRKIANKMVLTRKLLSTAHKLQDAVDFSMLRDLTYDFLVLGVFLNEFSVLLVFTYIPTYAISENFSQSTGLLALIIVNATGVVGRYVPSYIADKYGNFNIITVSSFFMPCFIFVLWVPFGNYYGCFMTFAGLFGVACASTLVLTPLCTSEISEPQNYGKAYGTCYFFCAFGNLISLPIGMALTGSNGNYQNMAIFSGVTSAIGTIAFASARYRLGGFKLVAV